MACGAIAPSIRARQGGSQPALGPCAVQRVTPLRTRVARRDRVFRVPAQQVALLVLRARGIHRVHRGALPEALLGEAELLVARDAPHAVAAVLREGRGEGERRWELTRLQFIARAESDPALQAHQTRCKPFDDTQSLSTYREPLLAHPQSDRAAM